VDSENQVRYLEGNADKKFVLESMTKYLHTKQELDKLLETLVTPLIQNNQLRILDACCGIGHIIYYLSQVSPKSQFLGIDKTPYLIEEAKKICSGPNIKFKVSNVYNLSEEYEKEFDLSICWKTLSWLPRFEPLVEELMNVTKKHVFISSLFYDGDIESEIKVREYQKQAGKTGFNSYYNVYSYPNFEKFCLQLGAKKVTPFTFELKIDIPKPPKEVMGTYTVRLENGKRLQLSGVVLMCWKVIRIDL